MSKSGARSVLGLLCLFLSPVVASATQPERPITLHLDATEAPRKLLHAHIVIPAKPGPLTLHYPKWIQGEHQPAGPINELSGLVLRAGGNTMEWKRDPIELYSFHCTVPEGADAVEVDLDYLGPTAKEGYSASATLHSRLAIINWHLVLLYPAGKPVRDIPVQADITLPAGWKLGTALPIENVQGATTHFKPASLETLADSTVLCGAYVKEVALKCKDGPPHFLVLACDSPSGLELSSTLKKQYENLIAEAGAHFGARHYRAYYFLFALSDLLPINAIEHHESSDNRLPERFLIDDSYRKLETAWVAAHEYAHSWNGKYRRPLGLATPDFQQPMKTELLWVYEGLTEYLGFVLAARSGLYDEEISRDNWANIANWASLQTGRRWRPLGDTTTAAPFLYTARSEWGSRRRGVDFYDEGALIWLDADTLIREKTGKKKSLDDFCKAFYGGQSGPPEVKPYTFEDVVQALNGVLEYDWRDFLKKRVVATTPKPPLDGLTRGGWKLVYHDTANELTKANETAEKMSDLRGSVGLAVKEDGSVVDVIQGKPADKAHIGPGMRVIGIDGRRFSLERLTDAVEATPKGGKLRLLLENGDYFLDTVLDGVQGPRYPHLERIEGKPDLLKEIFKPKAGTR
jgi:predicted metalloprotease with PDZ domain